MRSLKLWPFEFRTLFMFVRIVDESLMKLLSKIKM